MRTIVLVVAFVLLPAVAAAQDTTRVVRVGGFVDAYYAWDFQRPRNLDRDFTTQPARHDEFNINLAFLEAKVSSARMRGRIALQAGTSVQSNYAGEPRIGAISGPDLARLIQEAVAGFRIAPGLWLDGGIYFSHIGQEGWISRDNPTYTRSLIADYTPYYEAGVKVTWQPASSVTAQAHLLNGWQNISETNQTKAVGMRIDITPSSKVTVGYSNFMGQETPDTVPHRTRILNEGYAALGSGKWKGWVTADYGIQTVPRGGHDNWYGGAAIARLEITRQVAVAARVERYADVHQVIVATGTAHGFQVTSASFNIDITPAAGIVWRTEVRGFTSRDPIYPRRAAGFSDRDSFVVSSLALTLP